VLLFFVYQSGQSDDSEGNMKTRLLVCALLMFSCGKNETQDQRGSTNQDEAQIREMISSLYRAFDRAYNAGGVNTDSLVDAYYDKDIHYVTSWGWTEPIDTTKARMRKALAHVKEYSAHIESLLVKTYGDGAFAFFILRQSTNVDGTLLDEYLPTTFVFERRGTGWKIVHAHRSTDYETFEQYIAMQKVKSGSK
jgi:ketosteroid isomerase-like protein